jgi:hypothetical protein
MTLAQLDFPDYWYMMYARFLYEWDCLAALQGLSAQAQLRDTRLSLSLIENLLLSFSQHTSDAAVAPAQAIFVTHQLDFERPAALAVQWVF